MSKKYVLIITSTDAHAAVLTPKLKRRLEAQQKERKQRSQIYTPTVKK